MPGHDVVDGLAFPWSSPRHKTVRVPDREDGAVSGADRGFSSPLLDASMILWWNGTSDRTQVTGRAATSRLDRPVASAFDTRRTSA